MFDINQRYELELLARDGGLEIIQGRIIGRDGALVQIVTARGVRLLNILSSAFVSAHLLDDGALPYQETDAQ